MNNNASLQENNNYRMTASTASFIIDASRGSEYTIDENNGKKYVITKKGFYLGGMQPYETFIHGIEGSNPNLEMAKAMQLDKIISATPELQGSSYFDAALYYFSKALDINKINCLKQQETFDSSVLKSAIVSIAQAYNEQMKNNNRTMR